MILRPFPTTAVFCAALVIPAAALAQPQPVPPAQPVPAPAAPAPPSQPFPFPAQPLPFPAPPPDLPPTHGPAVTQPTPQPLPQPYPQPRPVPQPQPGPFAPAPQPWAAAPPPPPWWRGPNANPNEEPPAPVPEPPAGVTAKGLPFYQRGAVLVEGAVMVESQGSSGLNGNVPQPIAAIDLVARIPVLPTTFVDLDLPIGVSTISGLGNPMVGMHHVFHPADPFWVTFGGAFGFPVVQAGNSPAFTAANGYWDAERFIDHLVPFALRFGLEGHVGIAELRAELDPVWGVSFADQPNHFFAVQHAVEVQLGHTIGGGLRYQGVATATTNPAISDFSFNFGGIGAIGSVETGPDHYQGMFEPFFKLYHDPVLMRVGVLLPVDPPLGPPYKQGWGVRATLGWSLD